MDQTAETNEIDTPEEAQEYREQVIADMAAEDAGELLPDSSETIAAEKKTPVAKAEPVKEDPWKGVNPALKGMFDQMSSKVETLSASEVRLKQAESRIGSLTNELHAAKSAAASTTVAPTSDQMADASKTNEKWEELKEDYPDWAEAIESRLSKSNGGISKTDLDQQLKDLRESMKGETDRKIEVAVLSYAHPKYQETIDSEPYQKWLQGQQADIIAKTKSPKAEDAIDVLDRYVGITGQETQPTATEIARQRRERLRKSTVVPTDRKGVPVASEADMTDEAYRAHIGKQIFAE